MMRRATVWAAVCACIAAGCGGVDQQKFDRVYQAGKALQAEVQSSGGALGSRSRDRLKEFDVQINALQDHTIGTRESDALQAYSDAADAYRAFLRFRTLEQEGESTQIVLKGPDLQVATRFKLPVDTRSGSRVVNRAQALTILLQAAEQRLGDGNRIAKKD